MQCVYNMPVRESKKLTSLRREGRSCQQTPWYHPVWGQLVTCHRAKDSCSGSLCLMEGNLRFFSSPITGMSRGHLPSDVTYEATTQRPASGRTSTGDVTRRLAAGDHLSLKPGTCVLFPFKAFWLLCLQNSMPHFSQKVQHVFHVGFPNSSAHVSMETGRMIWLGWARLAFVCVGILTL